MTKRQSSATAICLISAVALVLVLSSKAFLFWSIWHTPACVASTAIKLHGVDTQDRHGWTTIHHAARVNRADLVTFILDHSSRSELRRSLEIEAPESVTKLGMGLPHPVFKRLLAEGAPKGSRAVMAALSKCSEFSENSYVKNVLLLLDRGVNVVEEKDIFGDTALHIACYWRTKPEIVAKLLQQGCSIDAKNNAGESPLCVAVIAKDEWQIPVPETVEILLKAGAKPNDCVAVSENGDPVGLIDYVETKLNTAATEADLEIWGQVYAVLQEFPRE